MKYYYDLHIHSCLSPCAEDDMTPSNIVGMAKVAGLDIIAVSDHNTVGNVAAAIEASEAIQGPLVIPAMEMETAENIHVLVLFDSLEGALAFEERIWSDCFRIDNRKDIYGNQLYMNASDEVLGERKELLLVATNVGVYDVSMLCAEYGGVAIYAHVDREAHGALNILGELDIMTGIKTAEISRNIKNEVLNYLTKNAYKVIYNSDAHRLWEIQDTEGVNYLELNKLDRKDVLKALK